MSKRKVADTPVDPTLPDAQVIIAGKPYSLCFDLASLAEAESAFLAEGHDVNLLAALPRLNLSNTRVLFAAAVRKFHPDLGFKKAVALVTLQNVYSIAQMIADAWTKAMPEAETEGEAQPEE